MSNAVNSCKHFPKEKAKPQLYIFEWNYHLLQNWLCGGRRGEGTSILNLEKKYRRNHFEFYDRTLRLYRSYYGTNILKEFYRWIVQIAAKISKNVSRSAFIRGADKRKEDRKSSSRFGKRKWTMKSRTTTMRMRKFFRHFCSLMWFSDYVCSKPREIRLFPSIRGPFPEISLFEFSPSPLRPPHPIPKLYPNTVQLFFLIWRCGTSSLWGRWRRTNTSEKNPQLLGMDR